MGSRARSAAGASVQLHAATSHTSSYGFIGAVKLREFVDARLAIQRMRKMYALQNSAAFSDDALYYERAPWAQPGELQPVNPESNKRVE